MNNPQALQQQLQLQQLQQQLLQQQQLQQAQVHQAQQKTQRKSSIASPALRSNATLGAGKTGTPPLRPGQALNPQQQQYLAQQQQRLMYQRQVQQEWIKNYWEFMKNIGKELTRFPTIGNKPIDLQSLMNAVVELGGYESVSESLLNFRLSDF
jgi:multidrug efflux pump subunit AcrA (membrane-fusion protein)